MSKSVLRRMGADPAGNVGIFLALAAVPLVACAGAAMDYINANQQRTELQARLDTAVLAAVSTSANGKAVGKRRKAAEKLFKENCNKNDCSAKLSLTFNGSTVRGTADFDMPTAFMRVVGINKMPISATAVASASGGAYYDMYLAIDISGSMGIGATVADQQKMQANFGCVFACHVNDTESKDGPFGINIPGNDTYLEKARALNIPIRLDAAQAAASRAVDDVEAAGKEDWIRFGVYSFDNTAVEVLPPTNDFNAVRSALSGLQLARGKNIKYQTNQPGDTAPDNVFDLLLHKISKKGDGTKSNPYKMVVYLSDGTTTNRFPHEKFDVKPLDYKLCSKLRDKGAEIAVIHTDYNFAGPEANWAYANFFKPVKHEIEPNMRACADSGMYYKTADPHEIDEAFLQIADKVTQSPPRLTQ